MLSYRISRTSSYGHTFRKAKESKKETVLKNFSIGNTKSFLKKIQNLTIVQHLL